MTVVQTAHGKVGGVVRDGISSFLGVPYGAELSGRAWFTPPTPPESWTGVRPATTAGPSAPQMKLSPGFDDLLAVRVPAGPGCLNVNVWTPSPGGTRAPVMVWIHGGAFSAGSGADPWYSGAAFARRGVVCVTINYRLGPLGFGWFDDRFRDLHGGGNAGLHDQLAALRWVQENIAEFGGDASNVTVFGESAGAMSICALLTTPHARGLFRRAICQSGNARQCLPRQIASNVTDRLLDRLGVRAGDTESLIAAGPHRLIAAADSLTSDVLRGSEPDILGDYSDNWNLFEPVVDGDLLSSVPIDAIATGAAADVDLLLGTTSEEWRLFRIGRPYQPDVHEVVSRLADLVGAPHAASVYDGYAVYAASSDPADVQDAIETDRFFEIPTVVLAAAQANTGAKVYLYRFAWRSPMLIPGGIGACHMLEIPFVFDNFANSLARDLVGPDHPRSLADAVHEAWVSFATDGIPRSSRLPEWPPFHDTTRQLMQLDERSTVRASDAEQRPLWPYSAGLPLRSSEHVT